MTKLKLNEQQQQAINHKDGALGVIAAAGSGKSLVLLERIKKLVKEHKVFEKNILAITFTRNTADELTEKLGSMGLSHVNVGTFHSICAQQLRSEGYEINGSNMIYDWQIENLFKSIDKRVDVKDVMSFIGYQKNYMIKPDDNFIKRDSAYSEDELRVYFRAYEDYKSQHKLYDFEDYLLLGLEMLRNNPGRYRFDYVLIDEHQDSNLVQNELLKEWSSKGNTFAVFDFRQAIYGFRGSNTEYSMNFEQHWDDAKVMNMHINYRSPKNVVEKANSFIEQYYGEYEHYVNATPYREDDGKITIDSSMNRAIEGMKVVDRIEHLLKNGVEPKDIAVLYRNNSHADYVENQLKLRDIDHEIANDGSFFKRREIAGILSMLRLVMDNDDDSAFEGVFRMRVYPMMYFSNSLFYDIQNKAQEDDMSLYDALTEIRFDKHWQKTNAIKFKQIVSEIQNMYYSDDSDVESMIDEIVLQLQIKKMIAEKYSSAEEREERINSISVLKDFVRDNNLKEFISYVYSGSSEQNKKKKDNAVQLMTIHRSKGLEWDNTFVIGIEDGEFPSEKGDSTVLEEARLMYVATTRSKQNLWVSEIGQNNKFTMEYEYNNT